MKISAAIKKVEKATSSKVIENNGRFSVQFNGKIIGFSRNGRSDEITCIHTMRANENVDSMTDYFPQIWHDNITKALKHVKAI